MQNKEQKLGIVIGRFSPFHKGHEKLIKTALDQCDKLIVLIGSSNRSRCLRVPFSFNDRQNVIRSWLENVLYKNSPSNAYTNVLISPIEDFLYDDTKWIIQVQEKVQKANETFNCDKIF